MPQCFVRSVRLVPPTICIPFEGCFKRARRPKKEEANSYKVALSRHGGGRSSMLNRNLESNMTNPDSPSFAPAHLVKAMDEAMAAAVVDPALYRQRPDNEATK